MTDSERLHLHIYGERVHPKWKSFRGLWMAIHAVAIVAVALASAFSVFVALRQWNELSVAAEPRCQFPAVFNFGDSNSDTGGTSAAFGRLPLPFGQTFFGKPSGRRCDGRLIIDFIAEKLRMPYLSAYLDSIGANFRHGANFAASGSTIVEMPCTNNPLDLSTQLLEFEQFKARTDELHSQGMNLYVENFLPRPRDFPKALYIIDSGQNDLHQGLTTKTERQVKASIPGIIEQFASFLEKLYQGGARTFWVHNTGPIGCLPFLVKNYPPKRRNSDQNGCVASYNQVAKDFNNRLKDKVAKLRTQMQDALIVYVDMYTAKYSLISQAKALGYVDPLRSCCGAAKEVTKTTVNMTEPSGTCCSNPSKYISWDTIHYTEAANRWIAKFIINGSFSDPPVAIAEACPAKPVGSVSENPANGSRRMTKGAEYFRAIVHGNWRIVGQGVKDFIFPKQ